jgi:hypothetical protein
MREGDVAPAIDDQSQRMTEVKLQVLASFSEPARRELAARTVPNPAGLESEPGRREHVPKDDGPCCHDSYGIRCLGHSPIFRFDDTGSYWARHDRGNSSRSCRRRCAGAGGDLAELSAPHGSNDFSASFRRSGPGVVDHVSVDADSTRARLQSELQFMQDLGGPGWSQTYVQPFYMKMPSGVPEHVDEVAAVLPRLRTLALELTSDDVASMLKMQWRIQVVAAWLAIARCDPWLSGPVHQGFDYCYGHLTSPSLTVAALSIPMNERRSVDAVSRPRHRKRMGGRWRRCRRRTATAIRGLARRAPNATQQWLEILLSRASQLQALAD